MYGKFEIIFFFKQFCIQLPADVIRKSFLACGISDTTDGSQDESTDFPPSFHLELETGLRNLFCEKAAPVKPILAIQLDKTVFTRE